LVRILGSLPYLLCCVRLVFFLRKPDEIVHS
jgi:hypothetical protein